MHDASIIDDDRRLAMEALEEERGDAADAETSQRRLWQRCCSWELGWKTLVWMVIVIAYLLLGGLVFMLAERPNERDSVEQVEAERERLAQLLEDGKNMAVSTLVNATNGWMVTEEADELLSRVANLSASLALASQELQAESSPLWTYSPAVFFSATVITTIGYGNIAPVTVAGQVLFIFYALIGIPLCLIFLSLVGEILSHSIDAVISCVSRRTKERPAKHQTAILGLTILGTVIVGLVLFVFFPAIIFYGLEDWTYGEAVYYCFVTLTTVGFGDFVPAQTSGSSLHAFYRICSAAWIIVGLAWVGLLITRIQTAIEKTGVFVRATAKNVRGKRVKKKLEQARQLVVPEVTITEASGSENDKPGNREST